MATSPKRASELEGPREAKQVSLQPVACLKFAHIANIEIERVLLSQFRGVRGDRTHAKSVSAESIQTIGERTAVLVELGDPTAHESNAETRLESLDGQKLQIREDAVLVLRRRVLRVKLYRPGRAE